MKGDGTTATQDWNVNPQTRLTVLPSAVLGVGDDAAHDFGTRVECTNGQQVFVERPMYFNYKEKWTGGHDVMGATSLENTFYFAEGYTGTDVFEEWLTMLNPGATTTSAHITYMFPDGATQEQDVAIGATTRVNVLVNEVVGPDKEVSVTCRARLQIDLTDKTLRRVSGGYREILSWIPLSIIAAIEDTPVILPFII